ncbi:glycosyltransferase family 2 protein [Aquimarina sp. ERC-38]|uniref:glycosyltransferase n=1 Tax=Aquimarina sp. ERC-38 TaxID=2949996 RepID=UPI002246AE15|nr:glycosyltransferase family 2 protein [Aquimarina sp. ERC-38]UZO82449.1 glycosyltransferase family 2 protein [Aquimarina sp. ERC-38]
MKVFQIYIVIPAYNEEQFIATTLTSLCKQSLLPAKILVVNDNSTDLTLSICKEFQSKYNFVQVISHHSSHEHQPGSKVINAFNYGLSQLDTNYDIICKYDADLIFPLNYLEEIAKIFTKDATLGMVGGFCYIKTKTGWQLENLTNKDHIRGALKAYRKECFKAIGGLAPEMGWDTVDEIKTRYHHWKIKTIPELQVKHLKPTGAKYQKKAGKNQGIAFYRMRYGGVLTIIASFKLALLKKKPFLIIDYIKGYFIARKTNQTFLLSKQEGAFLRKERWKGIKQKLSL